MTFLVPKSHLLRKPNQNKQNIAQENYSSIGSCRTKKFPRHFVESLEFNAVFQNLCLFHNFSRKSDDVLRKPGCETVVQKLEFLLYFSKSFYLVDNDVSRLEANKLPNGINLEARWSHMFPHVNTFFFQIVTLSTWINLKLIK
jgi:hypothetical protein